MRKKRGSAVSGDVKRDYLIKLGPCWYRIDTIKAREFGVGAAGAQSSVFSPANMAAIVSRGRTCTARAPSTITSHGRGREL